MIERTRSAKWISVFVWLVALLGWTQAGDATARSVAVERYPGVEWERAAPESEGWSPEALESAMDFAEEIGTDALLIICDGVVVAEFGDVTRRFDVRSIRKPLLGALIGSAIDQGDLTLERTLEELEIEEMGGLSATERKATLADLLTSRSGVYARAAWEHPSHAKSRPARGSHEPGTHFYYNNWDFNALGTIYNRVTESDLFEAYLAQVAQPLQMQDYRVEDGEYFYEDFSEHPAYKFHMTARDLARFGLLFLREGRWEDQQIVPVAWVRESTRTHVPEATPHSGYGYLWRTYPKYGSHYAATGAGSQMLVVVPDRKLVIAHLKLSGPLQPGVKRSDFWQLFGRILAAAPKSAPR